MSSSSSTATRRAWKKSVAASICRRSPLFTNISVTFKRRVSFAVPGIEAAQSSSFRRAALAARWRLVRLGDDARRDADVILVDRVGVLGDLYALADAAYVGGGFHSAGLHSVLEPAAFGAPVLFGPRHAGSRDAGLLLASGGGAEAASADALADVLTRWLGDAPAGRRAGDAARAVVQRGIGAAERSWKLVERLLDA